MIIDKAVSNYSKTLVLMAHSNERLEKWLEELDNLLLILNQTPAVEKVLYNPFIKNEEKKKILKELVADQMDSQLLDFLSFLIDRKRIKILRKAIENFRTVVYRKLGILDVSVTTATPIEEEAKERVKAKLEKALQKKIYIEGKVDPQIIGGMIVMIANEMFDDSIKSRLQKLREKLLEVNV